MSTRVKPVASTPVRYVIRPAAPQAHRFSVRCIVDDPDPAGQRFALPAWIPGSYMIREFARHIVAIRAARAGRTIAIDKIDKHTWVAAPGVGAITVTIEVYAFDTSVRGAYLDTERGFFNGPCVFLRVIGQESRACELEIERPVGASYRSWRVATSLERDGAPAYGFGRYRAIDYDELIDSPVELGAFTLTSFRAHGVPHDIVIAGRHAADMRRLTRDFKRICEHQIDLFGRPAPMQRYVFLVNALGEGYGGLEHRASTALLCTREDLPKVGASDTPEAYRTFLGLVSHEYFHTWNVKRIKPAAFLPYDLERENYTRQLWAFEGFTSYYDDLTLVRTGLITQAQYLELIAKSITALARNPGARTQSVAESSFDAWVKYYRQDENTPNVVVSYYGKGSLIGLALDLTIRERTNGRRSLDDVMRLAWRRYGKKGVGVPEDGIERLASEVAGVSLGAFFRRAVYGTDALPLARALASVGLELAMRPARNGDDRGGFSTQAPAATTARRADMGWRVAAGGEAKLATVYTDGAAEAAGLAAGDVIVAIDGLRATAKSANALAGARRAGERIALHVFRRDELFTTTLVASAAPADTAEIRAASSAAQKSALKRWLGARR
jgi:predicted metalloprotease with PDZ domain